MLGPVTRRVNRPEHDLSEVDLGPIGKRIVGERRVGRSVDAYRHTVLEGETPVPRDVVGVRMRLEHADEVDLVAFRRIQVLLDRVYRVDDSGDACLFVADQV